MQIIVAIIVLSVETVTSCVLRPAPDVPHSPFKALRCWWCSTSVWYSSHWRLCPCLCRRQERVQSWRSPPSPQRDAVCREPQLIHAPSTSLNQAAICVGQLFMNSSWWQSLAGKDLSVKTDGQEKEEGAIKLREACWASPYGGMNYRRLAMSNVTMQHIIPDWSFSYWLDKECTDKGR